MKSRALNFIKQLYGTTSTPVAAADENFNILWKNSAAEALDFFNCDRDFFEHINDIDEGVKKFFLNGEYHICNVIKFVSDEIRFIVEYIGKDTSCDISHMRDYFSFLCTRLRESASQISMAADDIDVLVKNGDANVASPLNKINRNVMLLLKEAVVPENVFYAAASECRDEPINLAHAVALSAEDAQDTLGRTSDVWQNDVDNVCAAVNASVFESVIAYMTVQVCCGELYPEKLEFKVERDSENEKRGRISVRGICLSGKKNTPFMLEHMKKNEFFTDVSFRKILAQKYGMSFETKHYSDGIECIMQLDVLPGTNRVVKNEKCMIIRQKRFSPMAISLSEKHCAERYKNIKMK